MEFKGEETDNGLIVLKAKHPPGFWQRLAESLQWFIGWLTYTAIVFGLGVMVGIIMEW